jgi:hypothetical protein
MTVLPTILTAVAVVIAILGLGSLGSLFKGCVSLRRLRRNDPGHDRTILLKSPLTPAVSVIATLTDDSAESFEFVRRLSTLQYSRHEVVVVLDGQSEKQVRAWTLEFGLTRSSRGGGEVRSIYESQEPLRIVLVDLEAGAVGNALDIGVETAACPVIGIVTPDSTFDIGLLLDLAGRMLEEPETTIAVCGLSAPPPEAGNLWELFGDLESLRTWMGRCAAMAGWNKLLPAPGASMLVRRDAVSKAGGCRGGALAMWLRLHAIGGAKIVYAPIQTSRYPRTKSWQDLRQRTARDQSDLARALESNGWAGFWTIGWGVPGLLTMRWLRPALETVAYLGLLAGLFLGRVDKQLAGLVLLSTVGLGILISMAAVVFRELVEFRGSNPAVLASLFFAAIPENLGYRQVRNLWLIGGIFRKGGGNN